MRAKAVIFTAPNTVEFGDVNCPDPGERDVVVDVDTSWISNGTEGSFLRGERIEGDVAYRDGDPWPFPIVAGYQKIGRVVETGAAVTSVKPGDRVFATVGRVDGMFHPYGGQLSPSVCDEGEVWKLRDESETGVLPEAYSGLVLTQVGYNCGIRPPVAVGDLAVVIGAGMVGQWAAQTLWWRGAKVILLGHHDNRLGLFTSDGTRVGRDVINTANTGWEDAFHNALGGKAVDVLVDTVGSIAAVHQFLPYLKRFSHVVSAGFYGTEDLLPLQAFRNHEATVDLVSGWQTGRMDETLDLVSKRILETTPLISHRFPAQKAADAWKLIENKGDNVLGVLLEWGDV